MAGGACSSLRALCHRSQGKAVEVVTAGGLNFLVQLASSDAPPPRQQQQGGASGSGGGSVGGASAELAGYERQRVSRSVMQARRRAVGDGARCAESKSAKRLICDVSCVY